MTLTNAVTKRQEESDDPLTELRSYLQSCIDDTCGISGDDTGNPKDICIFVAGWVPRHLVTGKDLAGEREQRIADALREKYDTSDSWGEHPKYSMSHWRADVADENTRLGYWEWVEHALDAESNENEI